MCDQPSQFLLYFFQTPDVTSSLAGFQGYNTQTNPLFTEPALCRAVLFLARIKSSLQTPAATSLKLLKQGVRSLMGFRLARRNGRGTLWREARRFEVCQVQSQNSPFETYGSHPIVSDEKCFFLVARAALAYDASGEERTVDAGKQRHGDHDLLCCPRLSLTTSPGGSLKCKGHLS